MLIMGVVLGRALWSVLLTPRWTPFSMLLLLLVGASRDMATAVASVEATYALLSTDTALAKCLQKLGESMRQTRYNKDRKTAIIL